MEAEDIELSLLGMAVVLENLTGSSEGGLEVQTGHTHLHTLLHLRVFVYPSEVKSETSREMFLAVQACGGIALPGLQRLSGIMSAVTANEL